MAMAVDHAGALSRLTALQQSSDLALLRLAEPLSLPLSSSPTANNNNNHHNRSSDASTTSSASINASSQFPPNPSPATLAADLAHYRELFRKLRFSYLEQVTKEKFLRAIVGGEGEGENGGMGMGTMVVVEAQDNLLLEAKVLEAKKVLKARKEEVGALVLELEECGRGLSARYENITLQTTQLATLPAQVAGLETTLAALQTAAQSQQQQHQLHPHHPHQNTTNTNTPFSSQYLLPLPATLDLLAQRQVELSALDGQLRGLQAGVERRTRELERAEGELRPLEMQRAGAVAAAREARLRREGRSGGGGGSGSGSEREGFEGVGGDGDGDLSRAVNGNGAGGEMWVDGLEVSGRWFRAVEMGVREVVGV